MLVVTRSLTPTSLLSSPNHLEPCLCRPCGGRCVCGAPLRAGGGSGGGDAAHSPPPQPSKSFCLICTPSPSPTLFAPSPTAALLLFATHPRHCHAPIIPTRSAPGARAATQPANEAAARRAFDKVVQFGGGREEGVAKVGAACGGTCRRRSACAGAGARHPGRIASCLAQTAAGTAAEQPKGAAAARRKRTPKPRPQAQPAVSLHSLACPM